MNDLGILASILGVILSCIGIILSIMIYQRQNKAQDKINEYNEQSLSNLKKYEQTGFDLLISLRNENLRSLSQDEANPGHEYWEFKWRFETWDRLTLFVKDGGGERIQIQILGTTRDFRNNTFNLETDEFFICRVIESTSPDFNLEDIVSCFYAKNIWISKSVTNLSLPEEKTAIYVGVLGEIQAGFVETKAALECEYVRRAKDFKIT